MKTVRIDLNETREMEDQLSAAIRILANGYETGIWSEVCREALLDIVNVRRTLEGKVLETVTEDF